jgi:hypothetical protein
MRRDSRSTKTKYWNKKDPRPPLGKKDKKEKKKKIINTKYMLGPKAWYKSG